MKKSSMNATGEMARWLRQNAHIPEVVPILQMYKKTFRFTDEQYKEAARLRERLEMEANGFTAPVREGLYYKQSTDTIYKVSHGARTAEWRPSERHWWSKDADMVSLYRDIRNGLTIRLTPQIASKIGLRTGVCCVCGRILSTKKSLELGIGPDCYKRISEPPDEDDDD